MSRREMRIGNRIFPTSGKTFVMGILNATPDSFSDGGRWNTPDRALFHAEEMILGGAAVLDIGGESTRPGFVPVSAQEETERILPVIEAVKARFDIPVSVDTFHAQTAQAALFAGADMINDVSALSADPAMGEIIAKAGIPCCLVHNRIPSANASFPDSMKADFMEIAARAEKAGISRDSMILDPGIGFGKTREQNLALLGSLGMLTGTGFPVLLGASRKSVIGLTLDLPPGEREEGTIVTTVLAVLAGCMFVRVHNVEANVRAVRMAEAVREASCSEMFPVEDTINDAGYGSHKD